MRDFRVTYYGTYCVVWLLVLFCLGLAQVAGDVLVVGSADGTAQKGLPQVGRSFLLYEISQSGTLFAISAYFVEKTNSSFQIWRPIDDPSSTSSPSAKSFKLIWQMTATPSVAGYREDIYMEAKFLSSCAFVRPGDWIGVVHLTSPAAVGAPFSSRSGFLRKMNEEIDGSVQTVGLKATFDMAFNYPYVLLLEAYFVTAPLPVNASAIQETAQCLTGLLIPSWFDNSTTTVATVTYRPGATGATGETGQTGQRGATGTDGAPGFIGVPGPMGEMGPNGTQGSTGPAGSMGPRGNMGQKGPPGATGPSGPMGTLGETGEPGPQGLPGNNTYQYQILPDAQPVQSDDELQSDGGLADQAEMRMGAIIWLALLSAVVVFCALMLVFVCYFVADDRRIQKNEAAWIVPK